MKTKITLVLVLILLCAIHSLKAQYTLTLSDVDFDASTGTIKDYTNSTEKDIIIPPNFVVDGNEVAVTSIGESAFAFALLTSLTIPNSVTSIEKKAFYYNDLTSLTIPNNVTSIGASVFSSNFLTSIAIPNGVISIGEKAFESNQLTSLTLPNSVTSIGELAFVSNQLTSLTIPNSVTSIGEKAFASNQLTSLTIPNSVTSIGEKAFAYNQLTSLTIPNSVTSIGGGAFNKNVITQINNEPSNGIIYARNSEGSEDLTTIVSYGGMANKIDFIPNSVTNIGESAFASNQLRFITIPNSVTSIGESAFESNQLTSLTLPNSVTSIGESAFESNQLTSLTIPNSVTSIGKSAFRDNQLTSLSISNSVISIGESAFEYNQLTSLTIPNSVTSIGKFAFNYNKLTSLTIPNSVTSIGGGAFNRNVITQINNEPSIGIVYARNSDGSQDLTTIVSYGGMADIIDFIPNSVTSIGESAFRDNQLTSLSISNSVISIGESAFRDNQLTSLSISNSVISIGESAFESNQLTSLTIPNSVTSIGNSAFRFNNFTSLTIPNGVISIGKFAFAYNQLTSLIIPNSVTSIGGGAFNSNVITQINNEPSIGIVYARNSDGSQDLTTIVSYGGMADIIDFIPNSVTSIGAKAFQGNQIISLIIPNSVTSIGAKAFQGNQISSFQLPLHPLYSSDGWRDNNSNTYLGGDIVSNFNYAYRIPVYDIHYNLDGGENEDNNPNLYFEDDGISSFEDPVKNGYNFEGWYANEEFTGDAITEIAAGSKGEISLWAKYTPIEYTITYHLNEGENSAENPATYTIESDKIVLAGASKENSNFEGWYANNEFIGKAITEIAKGSVGDRELWAKWEKITGVKEFVKSNYKFYPNPVVDFLTIESKELTEAIIYDSNGTIVKRFKLKSNKHQEKIGDLKSGVYYLKLGDKILKLIKK